MINLETNEIIHSKQRWFIHKFTVWWHVDGYGLYPEIQDALKVANGKAIQAMPVATGECGTHEVIPPNMVVPHGPR